MSDEPDAADGDAAASVLDTLTPAMECSSALAGELARLLLPARLFT